MASGYDSDVLVVEDHPQRELSEQKSNSSSVKHKANFCIERDGVPQDRPMETRVATPTLHNPDGSSHDERYPKRRAERLTKSSEFHHKRTRHSEASDANDDLDVIEIEESTRKVAAPHRPESASLNPQRRRHSRRLEEKRIQDKSEGSEYNWLTVRRDRMKRDGKRESIERDSPSHGGIIEAPSSGGHGDTIVLDDEDERRRPASAKPRVPGTEQEDKRNPSTTNFPKLTKNSEGREHDVVPVDEDEEESENEDDDVKESKNASAVDAPYTGSTHLIFEFPPGQRGKIRVTEEERGRLREKKYLNDSLIDFYLKYHETDIERRAHELRFSAVFFSSFFFGRLRRTDPIDYQGVRGWTKNVDIFSKRFIFVPICESYHWSLIIVANLDKVQHLVDNREEASQTSSEAPRIIYLDSLDPKRGTEFGETMRHYLVEEWLAKRLGSETNPATRKATSATFRKIIPILRPNVPIQTNEYDCGLYVLNSFEMFLNNTDGLRDKLLSGCRDVRDAYSHVEVAMLRKSIINLMDMLERQWACEQKPTGKGYIKRAEKDEKSSTVYEFEADGSGVYHLAPSFENFDYTEDSGCGAATQKLAQDTKKDEESAGYGSMEHKAATELVTVLDGNGGDEGQLEVPTTDYMRMDVENSTGGDG